MARNVVVGVIIQARDNASAAFGKVGKALGKDIPVASKEGKAALDTVEKSLNAVSSAMQIAEKVGRLMSEAIRATVGAALEQRAENDAQRQSMERLGVQFQRIAGLVGDVMIPIVLGVADALKPVLEGTESWLGQNKKLVGSGLVNFLSTTANLLVAGISTGLVLVTRGWTLLNVAISGMMGVAGSAFTGVLGGLEAMMRGAAAAARAFGRKELAASIDESRVAVTELRAESSAFADSAYQDVQQQIQDQGEFEAKVNKTADAIALGIGVAAINATERLGQTVRKIPPDFDKISAAAAKAAAYQQHLLDLWNEREAEFATSTQLAIQEVLSGYTEALREFGQMETRKAAIAEEVAKAQQEADDRVFDAASDNLASLSAAWALFNQRKGEQTDAANREIERKLIKSAATVTDNLSSTVDGYAQSVRAIVLGTVMDAIETGQSALEVFTSISKAIGNLILEEVSKFLVAEGIKAAIRKVTATQNITANAAEAASGAAASQAGIPIIGPALAIAAAVATFAGVLAFAGKFHTGGIVPGRPGEERLAILKAGELVVDENRAGAATAAGFGPAGSSGASRSAGGSSGGGRTDLTLRTILPSRVEVDSTNRRVLLKSTKRGQRLGWGV